ncbi:hypothetical protein BC831DRAFT_123155 [Entophlyctis helioformis]|nr:hypothetical protein BC831DRAFT_123155 [Entophlyctis helioformis]
MSFLFNLFGSAPAVPEGPPKQVVVIGGSFAGLSAIEELKAAFGAAQIHITLIEAHEARYNNVGSPRALVSASFVDGLFVPYTHIFATPAIGTVVHGTVARLHERHVTLANGTDVPFDYLIVTTGAQYPEPYGNPHAHTAEAVAELKQWEGRVRAANKVVVVGGGVVGIEVAAEVREAFPDKTVTIVSSGPGLNLGKTSAAFAARLAAKLEKMQINVIYNEKAVLDTKTHKIGPHTLTTESGLKIESDLTLLAIGTSVPNSQLVAEIKGGSLLNDRKEIKVLPTLQVADADFPHVFSFGDVAATGAFKMVMPAKAQASIVVKNIKALMTGSTAPLAVFTPVTDKQMMVVSLGSKDAASELTPILPTFALDYLGTYIKSGDLFTSKMRKDQHLPSA